ncbi:MAG TPA: redoxin domain-containing protein [Hanamia sp.]|nr:redoxin domain-containing protein [Hanamia sp.]
MKALRYFFLLFFSQNIFAQKITPLKLGDQFPDIQLGTLLDKPNKQLKSSDLNGKLVILDFWNIHCSSCILGMPRMDSLQKKFGNKIQILFITKNTSKEVNSLFARIKMIKPDLPFIISDTILCKLFPHSGDPLHVWITPNKKVYAITFDYSSNPETVQQFLEGRNPPLPRRRDFAINTEYPLLSEQNSDIIGLAKSYSSLFAGLNEYLLGISLHVGRDTLSKKITALTAINFPLLSLYSLAFEDDLFNYDVNFFNLAKNNRIILQVHDSADFFQPQDEAKFGNWFTKNVLSYEIKEPSADTTNLYKYMQQDLARYLPYKATIEKRNTDCLVLQKIDSNKLAATYDPVNPSLIKYNGNNSITFSNTPFKTFVMQLIYANSEKNIPIIDETGVTKNISVVIRCSLTDLPALTEELKKYGLTLKEGYRNIDMLIIKDK